MVLVTTKADADKAELIKYARANGISELTVPKVIHPITKMLVLGSGKVDY